MLSKIRRLLERGWGYYRLYGARRFIWALSFKIRQRLSRQSAASNTSQLDNSLLTLSASQLNRIAEFDSGLLSAVDLKLPFTKFLDHSALDTIVARRANVVLRKPLVSIIGDLGLPQCRKYRVIQKLEGINLLDIDADYSQYEDIYRALQIIQMSTFVIFYRMRDIVTFRTLINECKRLSIRTAYDLDDPIFSKSIYRNNINLDHLHQFEKDSLLASTEEYVAAMRQCDTFITSTPRMVKEMKALGLGNVYLWRNAIDAETEQAIHLADIPSRQIEKQSSSKIKIVYASGSRAHEADFRIVEDVIFNILRDNPDTEFHVIGYLELPEKLEIYEDRIVQSPFGDYASYIGKIAACDIAIVPLVSDDFNDCKSAIRYMEAAIAETPCIATAIGDFSEIVTDGQNGFLASSQFEWESALQRLIKNQDERVRVANNAAQSVRAQLGLAAIVEKLPDELKDLLHGR